jgi:hypothetical protein
LAKGPEKNTKTRLLPPNCKSEKCKIARRKKKKRHWLLESLVTKMNQKKNMRILNPNKLYSSYPNYFANEICTQILKTNLNGIR